MTPEYFSILGLAPGRYEPAEIERRFFAERARVLRLLDDAQSSAAAMTRLDEIHQAYAVLRSPQFQRDYFASLEKPAGPLDSLRTLIRGSLEDGLIRYSRRQAILSAAKSAGLSEFHAHLMIAQIQFGDERISFAPPQHDSIFPSRRAAPTRLWARFAAVALLGLTVFLAMIQLSGVK